MIVRNVGITLLAMFLFACNNKAQIDSNASTSEAAEKPTAGKTFGEAITTEGAISYDDLLEKISKADSMAVKVEGVVESVCQAKGCWMNIVSEDEEAAKMFVKFKDYGFFVPKDISGRRVVMDGYAYREVTSVDELRHYAEDEGKSKEEVEAITEPVEELKFMASGVLLLEE